MHRISRLVAVCLRTNKRSRKVCKKLLTLNVYIYRERLSWDFLLITSVSIGSVLGYHINKPDKVLALIKHVIHYFSKRDKS